MSNEFVTGLKLTIWGCGFEGEKLYYRLKQKGLDIVSVFDSFKSGYFHDLEIRNMDNIDMVNGTLILVSSERYYNEIKIQLKSQGLEEFVDFMPGLMLGKKMALINANCYGAIISEYLNSCPHFKEEYYIYRIPPIHLNSNGVIEQSILRNCSLFIHQDIKADNLYSYYLSDEYIGTQLDVSCVNITIPNLVGMGKAFFIQAEKFNEANRMDLQPYGMFPYYDKGGELLLQEGMESGINMVRSGKLYSEMEIRKNFNTIFEKFTYRETKWDVKIVDYIKANYKEKKLFYDIMHPTNEVIEQIAIGICKLLHLSVKGLYCAIDFGAYEMPIYPEVRLILELKYGKENEEIRKKSPIKLSERMDLIEYVKEYAFWCAPEKKRKG